MYTRFLVFLIAFSGFLNVQAQKPKLVVGIVVDQMRPDFLSRFNAQYCPNGFKRLLNDGYVLKNVHYNYVPTYTGPGHASIYSGTTPRYHGIVANDIYNRERRRPEYCVGDSTCFTVGNLQKQKSSSPARLMATNVCDELKICTNKRSKVYSFSLKDRAAILPAGHLADGAFWFDQGTGNFISSTFYVNQLPEWISDFNNQKKADQYISGDWTPLLSDSEYKNSLSDEGKYKGKNAGTFPYSLRIAPNSKQKKYSMLYRSPFANSLLTDLAIDAIKNVGFGKSADPDILAISFSSTDAVGHAFGPLSKETNDTYLRLDRDIARIIDALDKNVGKGNYIIFLTSDHGVSEIPQYLIDNKAYAGYVDTDSIRSSVKRLLTAKFGDGRWISAIMNSQIFLNRGLIQSKNLELKYVQSLVANFIVGLKGITYAYTASQLMEVEYTSPIGRSIQNGFMPKLSGDVLWVAEPGWMEGDEESSTVASHGVAYNYDTNVPLIWYGTKIKHGESWKRYDITDIAPTISAILDIKFPSAAIGNPIPEIVGR